MPLFFLIAGIFFKEYDSYFEFFSKKLRELIKPYLIFSAPLYLFWFFITRHFGQMKELNTSPIKTLLGIFIGKSEISSIEYGVPLWFLMCLFVVFNIYYFFKKVIKKEKYMVIIIILIIVLLDNGLKELIKGIPFYLYTSLVAILFFSLGNILKERIIGLKPNFLFFIATFYIFIYLKDKNLNVSMLENEYSNIYIFIFIALLGIYNIFQIVKILKLEKLVILVWLGKNTIPILCFHNVTKQFIKVIYQIFELTYNENRIFIAFCYCIIELILCLPVIFIYNKLIRKDGI